MTNSVILGGARTPVGKMNGALASKSSVELGGIAIREAIQRAHVSSDEIEHVIMGQVLQGGVGQIPSRQAAFNNRRARDPGNPGSRAHIQSSEIVAAG